MTEQQINWMKGNIARGRIEYRINKIINPGALRIQLNGKDLYVPLVKEGDNIIYFNYDDVEPGENWLIFSGTGGFDIDRVAVEIVR